MTQCSISFWESRLKALKLLKFLERFSDHTWPQNSASDLENQELKQLFSAMRDHNWSQNWASEQHISNRWSKSSNLAFWCRQIKMKSVICSKEFRMSPTQKTEICGLEQPSFSYDLPEEDYLIFAHKQQRSSQRPWELLCFLCANIRWPNHLRHCMDPNFAWQKWELEGALHHQECPCWLWRLQWWHWHWTYYQWIWAGLVTLVVKILELGSQRTEPDSPLRFTCSTPHFLRAENAIYAAAHQQLEIYTRPGINPLSCFDLKATVFNSN